MVRHHPEHGWQFEFDGKWRTFREPDGSATRRQLERLNREGRLRLVGASGPPVSKLAAAVAIDQCDEPEPAA